MAWNKEYRRFLGGLGQVTTRKVERMIGEGRNVVRSRSWEQTDTDQLYPKSFPFSSKKCFLLREEVVKSRERCSLLF